MHTCTCGRTFPGTLEGAWQAKLHADESGHRVHAGPAARAPARAPAA